MCAAGYSPFKQKFLQQQQQNTQQMYNVPSSSGYVRRVIAILLQAKQPLPISTIQGHVRQISKNDLIQIINDYPDNFEKINQGGCTYVKLITTLGLCETHCAKNQTCNGNCDGLHICKFYLLSGSCKFGGQCHFGHDLTTSHNIDLLQQNNLDGVTSSDLKFLLKQADNRTTVTVPKICKFYNVINGCRATMQGQPCPNLHICKHYIHNSCRFGKNCKRSHDIMDPGVRQALERFGFNTKRTPKEILSELREAIGDDGNDGESVAGPPQRWSSQPMLHGMSNLSLRPDDDADNFSSSGESTSSLPAHQKRRRQRPRGKSQQRPNTANKPICREISTDNSSNEKICLFHLRGHRCAFGQSCRNVHYDMPYQWLYKSEQDDSWTEVNSKDNVELELDFCDPKVTEHYLKMSDGRLVPIKFNSMTGTDIDGLKFTFRRMSTESSVVAERQPLATEWIWSWDNQTGGWKEYGEIDGGYKATISSSEIEQAFMANPEGQMSFYTLGHEYILDFPRMVQRNLNYKTEREVRRRPRFLDKAEVMKRQATRGGMGSLPPSGAKGVVNQQVVPVTVPPHWKCDAAGDVLDHYQKVTISRKNRDTREEYDAIEKIFCESMPSTVSIKSIERIENGELWVSFESKKHRMEKKKKSKTKVDERRLFHGTPANYVDPICRQGFDFRLSGQTAGTRYGKGSYFATSSKFSDAYTDPLNKAMFIVRVLVGEYALADSKYVRPPSKDKNNHCSDLYDSCVDNIDDPKIFVIFDNNGQVYPEYVITYDMKYKGY